MESIITPDWPAPMNVKAYVTTRIGGTSEAPYASLNLGGHVGDRPDCVAQNRTLLQQRLGYVGEVHWLNQVHSAEVIELPAMGESRADASYTVQPREVCAVLTADCLPVLFTNQAGTKVAVAHAGWRGLCDGVLEKTLEKFDDPEAVIAWMGPAIGANAFEVGDDVCEAFISVHSDAEGAFTPTKKTGKWLGDLYLLARQRLQGAGCQQIYGGDFCTFTDSERFFSYRRDGITGRMASLIWFEE